VSYSLIVGDLESDMFVTAAVAGVADDLRDADTVELDWLKPDGTRVTVPLVAVDAQVGQYKRVWEAGDTDLAGVHRGRMVVTWPTDEPQTYPNDGSWMIWYIYE
jgi:hypothetical protein